MKLTKNTIAATFAALLQARTLEQTFRARTTLTRAVPPKDHSPSRRATPKAKPTVAKANR